ncbi:hypothetical protein G443_002991 [Actinoalloteichus cyanogriseus DSM 43889]|uniref:Probable membrane transporter protein n=2 Tax=Actinoalloteichus cyanogriseus TaxID=2893586 RepID=A0ABT1JJM4_ACTCY|nr:hypothetical protein [Actinoalloteichus caeruleus DSM 43889]
MSENAADERTLDGVPWAKLVIIGLVAGALSGLFGLGGGVAIVPLLVTLVGFDQRQAVATSLLALAPLSVAGAASYAWHGQVNLWMAVPLAVGCMTGAWLGASLLNRAPLALLRWAYAVVSICTAVYLLVGPAPQVSSDVGPGWPLLWLLPIGLAIGVLSALTGIGGGAIMVPVMQLGFAAPAAMAKGTSLLVITPTSILGGARALRKGNGSLRASLWIGCSGVLATVAASQWSVVMDQRLSDRLFAALLVFVALKTVWGDLRALLRRRPRARTADPGQPASASAIAFASVAPVVSAAQQCWIHRPTASGSPLANPSAAER